MAAENVLILRSALALSLILTCASAIGAPVTLYLEGVVTQPNAGVNVSDPLRATFTFESSTQAVPYGNGGTPYTCPPLCEYLDPVTSASVTVGGKTWSLGTAPSGDSQSRLFVSDNAYTAADIFAGGFFLSGTMLGPYRPYYFDFGVTDPTGTRFNGAGLPRTFNLNGTYGNWGVDLNQTSSDYQFLYGQITYLSNLPPTTLSSSLSVNGNKLSANQETWVRYIAVTVIPKLLGTTRSERIQTAAISTWWALKEGILSIKNPLTYSNCSQLQKNGKYKDVLLKTLEPCDPGRPWQVGISGIQVPNFTESEISLIWDTDVLLSEVVKIAGFDPDTEPGKSIINSSGDLKKSWLLRHPVVGVTLQEDVVNNECIIEQLYWCYGQGWKETKLFAPTMEAALVSIEDLKKIFDILAP